MKLCDALMVLALVSLCAGAASAQITLLDVPGAWHEPPPIAALPPARVTLLVDGIEDPLSRPEWTRAVRAVNYLEEYPPGKPTVFARELSAVGRVDRVRWAGSYRTTLWLTESRPWKEGIAATKARLLAHPGCELNVVAHSNGNPLFLSALAELRVEGRAPPIRHFLSLASPLEWFRRSGTLTRANHGISGSWINVRKGGDFIGCNVRSGDVINVRLPASVQGRAADHVLTFLDAPTARMFAGVISGAIRDPAQLAAAYAGTEATFDPPIPGGAPADRTTVESPAAKTDGI